MGKQVELLAPDDLARPGGHYSHTVRSGDLVFTAGQLGVRPDGSHTADLRFEDQMRQTMTNMFAALRVGDAEAANILKVTAYIVGVENWPRFNAVYGEMMGEARPARTVVPVPELHHGYLIEIDAIAVRGAATTPREPSR
ncbi:MAG: RidA family protein [Dehalococcoidia bacterium]|nr:RidA family protein [Dehalococcoidia bacterium]